MASASLRHCLPEVFASSCVEGSPMAALVAAADRMHQPVAEVLDHLDAYVDPFRTRPELVAYLASWVDLDWLTLPDAEGTARSSLPLGHAPLRDLICARAELSATRGTAAGLVRFLELATRVRGFAVEDAGGFHLRVRVPAEAADQADIVARIVRAMKPAHVTAEILPEILPEVLPPDPPTGPASRTSEQP